MGTRFRKSINLGGGARLNLSKSGVGFSAGVKGARVTKTAKGTTRTTLSIPGTGLSHVTETSAKRPKRSEVYSAGYATETTDDELPQEGCFDDMTEEQIRDSIMRQVCQLELKCKDMEQRLGKNNPEVVKARVQVDSLRLKLAKMGIVDFEYPADIPAPAWQIEPKVTVTPNRVRTVFCPGCGTEMAPGARFCPECGQAMGREARQGDLWDFREKPAGWVTVSVRVLLWILVTFALLLVLAASPVGKLVGIAFAAAVAPIKPMRRIPLAIRIPAAVVLFLAFVMTFA